MAALYPDQATSPICDPLLEAVRVVRPRLERCHLIRNPHREIATLEVQGPRWRTTATPPAVGSASYSSAAIRRCVRGTWQNLVQADDMHIWYITISLTCRAHKDCPIARWRSPECRKTIRQRPGSKRTRRCGYDTSVAWRCEGLQGQWQIKKSRHRTPFEAMASACGGVPRILSVPGNAIQPRPMAMARRIAASHLCRLRPALSLMTRTLCISARAYEDRKSAPVLATALPS